MDAGVELRVAPQVPDALQALLVDPQTSGGLLAAVPADLADALIAQGWVGIGHVESGPAGIDVR
jgi:selenophosphate synthase